jgi:hypothetical protein
MYEYPSGDSIRYIYLTYYILICQDEEVVVVVSFDTGLLMSG